MTSCQLGPLTRAEQSSLLSRARGVGRLSSTLQRPKRSATPSQARAAYSAFTATYGYR
jgi:hypothetical protein